MERYKLIWFVGLLNFLTGAKSTAETYTVLLIDQHDQPIESVVVIDPAAPLNPSSVEQTPAIMDQVDMQFSPMVIAVQQGRKVSFPNSDNIRHHVYSFSDAKRFETKLYANTPDSPIVFDQPGLVVLGCNIHDTMIGYIYVSETQAFSVSDKKGKAEIHSSVIPNIIEYWHPWSDQPNKVQAKVVSKWPENNVHTIKLTVNRPQVNTNSAKKRFGNRW